MPESVTVGVDLGGTRIRVLARGSGAWSRRVQAPAPAPADLPRFLRRLWRQWAVSRRDVEALVVASRGIWTTGERRDQARRLRGLARRLCVISDAEAAFLGALGQSPGLLVLAGTGSIVLGRDRLGRWARAGGLGPLLGDEGSAFWIGREWLRAMTRRRGVEAVRRITAAPEAVRLIAGLAPSVLRRARRGDRVAQRIVHAAQEHLAGMTREVARQLRLGNPVAVSWAGSLVEDRRFREGLWRALGRTGVRARRVLPARPAVSASHALAVRLARGPAR